MDENYLSKLALDACFKIHKTFGPGLLESVYEAALTKELKKMNLKFTRQQKIPVLYEGEDLGIGFRADIIIESRLLLELKSVKYIEMVHHKTVLTYLKLTGIKLGLLVNFNVALLKDGISRKIMGDLHY